MRFDVGGAILSATPSVFMLYDATDNPLYYNLEGTEPTLKQWLNAFFVSADAACKVEIGLCLANRSGFVPYYATYATKVAGGVEDRIFGFSRYLLTMDHATIKRLAIRVSVAVNATVNVAGAVDIASAGR